jgi:ABC-2 type transport system permease protein
MRRALHRHVVWVLIALALVGCIATGVIAFVDSAGKSLAELHVNGASHPAVMRDWWIQGGEDPALGISFFFLLLFAFFGGASVAGAEWRAGTVTTVLTWEPRRLRVFASRTAACGVLAAIIAFAMQAIFLGFLLPAVLMHGSTAGTDSVWWTSLLWAVVRASLLTGVAAMLGVALATIGRNTAFAVLTVFMWLAVFEGVVRGVKPGWAQYLWGENVATSITWAQLSDVEFRRGPLVALGTVLFYAAVFVVAAAISFRRRDIASTT